MRRFSPDAEDCSRAGRRKISRPYRMQRPLEIGDRGAAGAQRQTQLVLDIDSDELNAFDQTDQIYLEFIVATIAKKNFSNANEIPGYPGTQARRL
jgi:hypothetical protein